MMMMIYNLLLHTFLSLLTHYRCFYFQLFYNFYFPAKKKPLFVKHEYDVISTTTTRADVVRI